MSEAYKCDYCNHFFEGGGDWFDQHAVGPYTAEPMFNVSIEISKAGAGVSGHPELCGDCKRYIVRCALNGVALGSSL